jgi:hypothetical protein
MKIEIIKSEYQDYQFKLILDNNGFCFCPICGIKSEDPEWRPYNDDGTPTYDICECGFEYGFDDNGIPPYEKSWKIFREKWIKEELDFGDSKRKNFKEKKVQLKNIGIDINNRSL